MDYEIIDKNGNFKTIKDVIFTDTTERVLMLQTKKGGMNYFNVDEIISAVVVEEENNG